MTAIVKYDTAGDIVNRCAAEVGLPAVSDPFSSGDPNFVQLCALLDSVGIELLGKYEWQNLIQTYSFNTVYKGVATLGSITGGSGYTNGSYTAIPLSGGTGTGATANITVSGGVVTVVTINAAGQNFTVGDVLTAASGIGAGSGFSVPVATIQSATGIYTLPADFDSMIDQSGWAQNYHWPLRGPYSAQVWQQLVNYPAVGIYLGFRIEDNTFMVWPPSNAGQNINFKYMSRYWAIDGVLATGKDNVSQSSDIVQFDWMLPLKLLKVRWLEAKGFDTTAAANQFNDAWDSRVGKNLAAAAPLDLARSARFPYLNGYNVPDLGFGAPAPPGGGYQ